MGEKHRHVDHSPEPPFAEGRVVYGVHDDTRRFLREAGLDRVVGVVVDMLDPDFPATMDQIAEAFEQRGVEPILVIWDRTG